MKKRNTFIVTLTVFLLSSTALGLSEIATVTDEPHIFTDPFPIILDKSNVDLSSIEVTDSTGISVYADGDDYTVTVIEGQVLLYVTPMGATQPNITDGQMLLIDYSYTLELSSLSILNYNVNGIGASGTDGREALQRIVDYLDPDIIIFQEAKGTTYPNDFLTVNSDYEGYYSSGDGAWNRRMIMSKFDIVDESVREHTLDPNSYRTLYAATIDLPGPHNLEVFTAHWHSSDTGIRDNESAVSALIIEAYQLDHPNSLYIYAGDFNDEDTSYRITNLLAPDVGLNMFTPVDQNNSNNATINSDPEKGTYLDRRIDYILPSNVIAALEPVGSILNTWTYTAETIPASLPCV